MTHAKTYLLLLTLAAPPLSAQTLEEGIANYRQHRYDLAEKILLELSQQQPDDPTVSEYLALSLVARKKYSRAEAEIGKAEKLQAPRDRIAVARARLALARRDRDEAAIKLNEAIDANRQNADAHQLRALLAINARDYAAAKREIEQALELRRDDPYDHFYAALAANGLGRRAETISLLERFVSLAPQSPDVDRVGGALRAMRR
jgi:tetratricopeptide (TPR) repeat protein